MAEKHQIRCPICKKPVEFFADPLGPFCSARCKMIDLGGWLKEDYKISDPLTADDFAEYEALTEQAELDRVEEEDASHRRSE